MARTLDEIKLVSKIEGFLMGCPLDPTEETISQFMEMFVELGEDDQFEIEELSLMEGNSAIYSRIRMYTAECGYF